MGLEIIAHRGASARELENTLEAFRLAKELGADWVEMDVRQTSDGVLVLHHDAHLANSRSQPIASIDSQDLPPHVPTLAQALEVCEGVGVVVEIKNDPREPGYDSENLQVHTWTANEADLMRRLISDGVDAIVTDCPDMAVAVRQELEQGKSDG